MGLKLAANTQLSITGKANTGCFGLGNLDLDFNSRFRISQQNAKSKKGFPRWISVKAR